MNYNTDIASQTITINNITYSRNDIVNVSEKDVPFSAELLTFLKEWYNSSKYMIAHSSGSTGTPKKLKIEKQRMLQSALLTCQFLDLQRGDSALLCMNLKYIGAKMVVVRSLLAGLNLVEVKASGNPMVCIDATDFAAMTPLQVFNSLQDPKQKVKLMAIRHLIIGGGSIDENLSKELSNFPNTIWSTYGMTETLSHIALRQINGESASEWYTPFENVTISLSESQTLVINAPAVSKIILETNDIAEINDKGQFRILGRSDNIINSGGVKIQIEEVETILRDWIDADFMITSVPDSKFGEIVVLLIKGENYLDKIQEICNEKLPEYWIPKAIYSIPEIPYTETNKLNRKKAKLIADTLHKNIKSDLYLK